MNLLGKVHSVCPKEEGFSAVGNPYVKRTIVVAVMGEKLLAVDFFGDRMVDKLENVETGCVVDVHFSIDSRKTEKDGIERWFTSLQGNNLVVLSPAN